MKTNAVIRIIIFCVIICILGSLLVVGLTNKFDFNWLPSFSVGSYNITVSDIESYGTGNTEVPSDGIKKLDIDWLDGSVTILPSDGGVITVHEEGSYSENETLRYKVDGDTLRIIYCTPRISFGSSWNLRKKLTVSVPSELLLSLEQLKTNCISAELNVSSAGIEKAKCNSVSGDTSFTKCVISSLTCNSVSGKISFAGSGASALYAELETVSGSVTFDGVSEKVKASSVSGEIRLSFNSDSIKDINCDTTSGRMNIYMPSDVSFTVDFDSVSGDFDCDFPTVRKDGKYICGDGTGCEIEAESVSGDVNIAKINM